MELKNGREIEKLNAKIEELREKLEGSSVDNVEKIEEELFSLEAKRDQMLAFATQEIEEDEDGDF